MALYVYICPLCGNVEEKRRSMEKRDDPVTCNVLFTRLGQNGGSDIVACDGEMEREEICETGAMAAQWAHWRT